MTVNQVRKCEKSVTILTRFFPFRRLGKSAKGY